MLDPAPALALLLCPSAAIEGQECRIRSDTVASCALQAEDFFDKQGHVVFRLGAERKVQVQRMVSAQIVNALCYCPYNCFQEVKLGDITSTYRISSSSTCSKPRMTDRDGASGTCSAP